MDARTKAILIAEGSADIDPELLARLAAESDIAVTSAARSTAGPGAGLASFFFTSGGNRVRLDAKRDPDAHLRVRVQVRLQRTDESVEERVGVADDDKADALRMGLAAGLVDERTGVADGDKDPENATERTRPPPESTRESRGSRDETGDVVILYDGRELVRGRIEPALLHCPEQAYITLSESCIFDCTFCPVPKLGGRTSRQGSNKRLKRRSRVPLRS
jgi:hypothetical protein